MINRIIIRIKVLQIVYAYYQNENKDLSVAENELMHSLSKSYDLYHYLLLLIPAITLAEQKRIDILWPQAARRALHCRTRSAHALYPQCRYKNYNRRRQ